MPDPSQLVQYGGTGLAFYLVWVLYRLLSNHEKHFLSMVKEQTDATRENTKVLAELKEVILSLKRK